MPKYANSGHFIIFQYETSAILARTLRHALLTGSIRMNGRNTKTSGTLSSWQGFIKRGVRFDEAERETSEPSHPYSALRRTAHSSGFYSPGPRCPPRSLPRSAPPHSARSDMLRCSATPPSIPCQRMRPIFVMVDVSLRMERRG